MYEWAELIKLWEREQVTLAPVIGQLLKDGEAQQVLLTTLQRRLAQLEQTVRHGQERRSRPMTGSPRLRTGKHDSGWRRERIFSPP